MNNDSIIISTRRSRGLLRASTGACFLFTVLVASSAVARSGTSNCQKVEEGSKEVGKTIAGLECQIDVEDRHEEWGYNSLGQICNNSGTEDLVVHCPLLRTEVKSTEGLYCAVASLMYWDDAVIDSDSDGKPGCGLHGQGQGEGNSPWRCVIQSKDETGVFGWWYGYVQAGGIGAIHTMTSMPGVPGGWKIEWASNLMHSNTASHTEFVGASYYLSCELPATLPQSTGKCGGSTCLSSLRWFEKVQ
jgi:hypothetical protein